MPIWRTVIVWISVALAVGVAMGVIAATYLPWLKNKGDTAFLIKKAANNPYNTVVLHGTVYIGAAVTGFIYFTMKDWKPHEDNITWLDIRTLWAGSMWTAFTTWAAFMSKKVAEFGEEKKKRDGTKPPIPESSGRLTTLG